jgi:hypothetical protein
MRAARTFSIVALLSSALLATVAVAASKAESKAQLEEMMSLDGLSQVKVKGIDLAYKRPGASLAAYDKVMLDPVEVAFSKNWNPDRTGSHTKLSTQERENIRSGVAKIVQEELVKELQRKGGIYQIATAAGPDVLRVKANVINLYVNAPDTMTAGRSRTYTVSAGEMTLFAELYDSESGEVIARVVDRQEARSSGTMMLTNSVVNASEARAVASSWGRILRTALDKAHDIGK